MKNTDKASETLESVLAGIKNMLILCDEHPEMANNFCRSAMVDLRRMEDHIVHWLVAGAGLWDVVTRDERGKKSNLPPTAADCIHVLQQRKKIDEKSGNMLNRIRKLGNIAAHEDALIPRKTVQKYLDWMQSYLPIFLSAHPRAMSMSADPQQQTPVCKPQNETKKPDILGCDIGNGYAFVSVLKNALRDPLPLFPVKYRLNNIGMPAVAYIQPPNGRNIEVFNERPAELAHRSTPDLLVRAVKTKLRNGTIRVPGIDVPVSADAIYAAIARDLVTLANKQRVLDGEAPVYDLVYSFPAELHNELDLLNRMKNSIESVVLDGHHLHVVGRLPEPAAVAIDYLYGNQYSDSEKAVFRDGSFTALVYDLGHGTFDTAVVTANKHGDPYKLHLFDGVEVGGQDFDDILNRELLDILLRDYQYKPQNSRAVERVRQAAVDAKHALSTSTFILHPVEMETGDYAEIPLTRARFERLSRPLLNKTLTCIHSIADQAASKGIKIDAVVLSGGASQMPMVRSCLEEIFSPTGIPVILHSPQMAVSFGTARFAYGLSDKKVLEQGVRNPSGIMVTHANSLEGEVNFLLPSGAKLPAVSKPIRLFSNSDRVVLRLCQAKKSKDLPKKSAPLSQCKEIMRIPFSVPANTSFEISLTMEEDYNISVTCRTEDGRVETKSTADELGKLVN